MDIQAGTVSIDEVVTAVCRMLEPIAKKGVLPDENRYGIDVAYHKQQAGLLMFHFVTEDLLEVNLEFDMLELQRDGRRYIDSRAELISMQLREARKERQRENSIELQTVQTTPPSFQMPLAQAVRDAAAKRVH